LIASLFLSLIGCAPTSIQIVKPYVDPQYGMTKMQMIDLLGKPDSIEIYRKTDLTRVEFYIYHRIHQSSQEKVPVGVIDGKVAGWGTAYYVDHISPDDVRIK